jgi:RNA polymerase sigma factor (TIGR02999 family)
MQLATTHLLREIGAGNRAIAGQLFEILYEDLRARAGLAFRSERGFHTLQPTALVHEAYLKLIDQRQANWKDRAHFCGVAALAMRRILVDYARKRGAQRRGAGARREDIPLDSIAISVTNPDDVIFVHELIEETRVHDERQAQIMELRFFADMTVAETAEVLQVSPRFVEDEWTYLRAVIRSRLAAA